MFQEQMLSPDGSNNRARRTRLDMFLATAKDNIIFLGTPIEDNRQLTRSSAPLPLQQKIPKKTQRYIIASPGLSQRACRFTTLCIYSPGRDHNLRRTMRVDGCVATGRRREG